MFESITHPVLMNSTDIESRRIVSPGTNPAFSVNTGIPNEQLPGAECSDNPPCFSGPSDATDRSHGTYGQRAHSRSELSSPDARTEQNVNWIAPSPCYHGIQTNDKTTLL